MHPIKVRLSLLPRDLIMQLDAILAWLDEHLCSKDFARSFTAPEAPEVITIHLANKVDAFKLIEAFPELETSIEQT
jgi:hypothetical protein